MINITLTSDYGNTSHYIAAIKGNLYKSIENSLLIDISHSIEHFNKIQAAFVIGNTFKHFKDNSIHLVCVDASIVKYKQIVVVKFNNQFFVALDNGILNLIFADQNKEVWIYNQPIEGNQLFIENTYFVLIAKHIAAGKPLDEIAIKSELSNKLIMQNVIIEKDSMLASITFIDGFGNAFLNVNKKMFDDVRKGRKFKIFYARKEFFENISEHYNEVSLGAELILFNESNFLEIAINEGNASQLLGLRVGSKIIIEFF